MIRRPPVSPRMAATFGVASVVALLITPFLLERYASTLRERISGVAEPARADAASIRLSLALEVATVRGYLLSQDQAMLVEFADARAMEKSAFDRLFSRMAALGDDVRVTAVAAHAASTRWNEANEALLRGELSVPDFITRLTDRQLQYRAALSASSRLESAIAAFASTQRQHIQQSQTVGVILLAALTLLATASALVTIRFSSALNRQTELARTDSLTGLLNRRAFEEVTEFEMRRAARYRYPVTVLYIDVDDFKAVNDERGHAGGDQLIQDIGASIRAAIRRIDVAARLGGDEFAIMLSENGASVSEHAAARIREAVLQNLQARHESISLSMGAVTAPAGHGDVATLLRAADEMMYTVKRENKGHLRWMQLTAA